MRNTPADSERLLTLYDSFLRLERGLSDNTRTAYAADVSRLLEALAQESIPPEKASQADLEAFVASLHDIGIAPRSQARIISGMKSFYRFLFLEHYIDTDPTLLIPTPNIGEHLPEVLTVEEIDEMVAGKGFRDNWNGQGVNYLSDRLALEDMHPANVFIDEITGRPTCIDCIVKFVVPNLL